MNNINFSIKPLVLVILDGWGISSPGAGNAIALAKKPYFTFLLENFPQTQLIASGVSVGLPNNEAGNSEVGHLNIGAGRIVFQDLSRINSSIKNGSFFHNAAFQKALQNTLKNNSNLHLLGLVGRGVVHSSLEHLYALLQLAKENQIEKVFLHLFLDGRDSPPTSGFEVISELEEKISKIGVGKIASIMGRYWAMDRDKRWERTKRAYDALVLGEANLGRSPSDEIENFYEKKITDEFIDPVLFTLPDKKITVNDNDSLIFFNFRADRARQLVKSLLLPNFTEFQRRKKLKNVIAVTMTEYEKNLPVLIAFPSQNISKTLTEVISDQGLKQLHIGETEKYAHVTYFFNGGRESPFFNEDRVHITSPKVSTYDLKPEMSAREITEYVIEELKEKAYDFYLVNFANADMVAHTGSIEATVEAIEVLDSCLEKIGTQVIDQNGGMLVTADHGNAEVMIDPATAEVCTEHSSNRVPFIAVANQLKSWEPKHLKSGILADIAPTLLYLMGFEKPKEMTGKNLF